MDARYDDIGRTYTATRREDGRIAARLHAALGDARTVVNVGAGTGSYEPRDRWVLAVEPSATMIAQRPPDAAPVIQASAEALPLADASVDAALATLTIHHWADWRAGVAELLRVTRRRVVIWTFDPDMLETLWIARDYLPEAIVAERGRAPGTDEIAEALGGARVEPLLVPRDCEDGFAAAYYARPERYLDPLVRAGISAFAGLDGAPGIERLADDLRSGAWDERYGHLRELPELDAGYRLVVAEW